MADDDDDVLCLEGPLERIDGKLVLMIPLDAGGDELRHTCTKISEIVDEQVLKVLIPDWLAAMLQLEEGDLVEVDNANGKFNLRPVNPRPIH